MMLKKKSISLEAETRCEPSRPLTGRVPPTIHFIGIGGIGMSALARYFLSQGWNVSGSDLGRSDITRTLVREGVRIRIGLHHASNVPPHADMVIYSQAIHASNSEFRAAHRLSIPSYTYPEAIGMLTKEYETVAIAGSHGKSTTTALTSLIMLAAKYDPTIVIGTMLKELQNSNFRAGKGGFLVLEADEWRAAFLHYSPAHAIVTNIDREHLDYYKGLPHLKRTFLEFLGRVREGGIIVLNRDDKNLWSLQGSIARIAKKHLLRTIWYSLKIPETKFIKRALAIPGIHVTSNALAAYSLTRALGISKTIAIKAIHNYKGAWRRFEFRGFFRSNVKGQWSNVRVYDDYAHHPTEIRATLQAFREKYPRNKIVCVFQPHQVKRLAVLFKEFIGAFNDADAVVLLPVYQVAGRDAIPGRYTSESLARALQKKYPRKKIIYCANPRYLKRVLGSTLDPNDYTLNPIVVMMGAGDIVNYTNDLLP